MQRLFWNQATEKLKPFRHTMNGFELIPASPLHFYCFYFDQVSIPLLTGTDPVLIIETCKKRFNNITGDTKPKLLERFMCWKPQFPLTKGHSSQDPMLTDWLPGLCRFNTVKTAALSVLQQDWGMPPTIHFCQQKVQPCLPGLQTTRWLRSCCHHCASSKGSLLTRSSWACSLT